MLIQTKQCKIFKKDLRLPKFVIRILKKLENCFKNRNRCIHCHDCIAFALIYAEENQIDNSVTHNDPRVWKENLFTKFLRTTINKRYLTCAVITDSEMDRFSKYLSALSVEDKGKFRRYTKAHTEFKYYGW